MATVAFFRAGLVLSILAFVFHFIAFASPYWYKSWTRVHSPFGNIGLWHVCLNGYIMPRDPVMKSYVGCWWIHSTEFDAIDSKLMPVWFRFIQAFCVFVLIFNFFAMVFTAVYLLPGLKAKLYKKRPRMFYIISGLLFASTFLVFLIALVFAEMSNDSGWMPRPWMNYLSWSYGLCVVSGFFSALGGMALFILASIYADKEERGDNDMTTAAELARKQKELEKQDEAMRNQPGLMLEHRTGPPQYGSNTVYNPRAGSGSVYPPRAGHGSGAVYPPRAGSGTVYQQRAGSGSVYPPAGAAYKRDVGPHRDVHGGGHKPPSAPSVASSDTSSKRVGESFV